MAILSCISLKKSLLPVTFSLSCLFGFIGCSNEQSVNTAASIQQVKPIVETKADDARFLVRAAEFKWNVIMLSKLASRRSGNDEVRLLSQTLENANRESKSSLGSLAVTKSIRVPYEPTQAANDAYTKLNESSIEDFDIAYCTMIIQDHKDAIALFEGASYENLDAGIKSWASSILPELRNHLSKAVECETHLNPMSELVK
ncbi:MAG TPA: DUF4142 domain-containing protein [Saprospiraceae bacterium]|nr:DUF4142 domain-containing protein [Saprospiraceae bacterium]